MLRDSQDLTCGTGTSSRTPPPHPQASTTHSHTRPGRGCRGTHRQTSICRSQKKAREVFAFVVVAAVVGMVRQAGGGRRHKDVQPAHFFSPTPATIRTIKYLDAPTTLPLPSSCRRRTFMPCALSISFSSTTVRSSSLPPHPKFLCSDLATSTAGLREIPQEGPLKGLAKCKSSIIMRRRDFSI